MDLKSFALCVFVALFVCAPASALYGSGSPVQLTTAQTFFADVNKATAVTLVEFFAPWCGHCKAFESQYEQAAVGLEGYVNCLAMNCDDDKNKLKCQELNIQGFPTIITFENGKAMGQYEGDLTAASVVKHSFQKMSELVTQRMEGSSEFGWESEDFNSDEDDGEDAVYELTKDNFAELVYDSDDFWMVKFMAPWCGYCKKFRPVWDEAAVLLKGKAKFGVVDATNNVQLAEDYNVEAFPEVRVFNKGNYFSDYKGKRTTEGLVEFVEENLASNAGAPLEATQLTTPQQYEDNCVEKTLCVVAFLPHILDSTAAGRQEELETLKNIGEEFPGQAWGFFWSEAGAQADLEASLDVGGYGYPALQVINHGKKVAVAFSGTFTYGALVDFLNRVKTGRQGSRPIQSIGGVVDVAPWDGKDGEVFEEEFDLSDLMD